jgi:hypothetical protein
MHTMSPVISVFQIWPDYLRPYLFDPRKRISTSISLAAQTGVTATFTYGNGNEEDISAH